MPNIQVEVYKGYSIKMRTEDGRFYADGDHSPGWFDTLKTIRDKIDRLAKAETKGEFPIPVYSVESSIVKGKITSINTEAGEGWFVSDTNDRHKVSSYASLFKVNPHNDELVSQIEKSQSQRQALFNQERALKAQFIERITIPSERRNYDTLVRQT